MCQNSNAYLDIPIYENQMISFASDSNFHGLLRLCSWTMGLVINYGDGATKQANHGSETLCIPLPQDRIKPFETPLLKIKEWKLIAPPINMAKTSSYRVKTTSKLVVPPPLSAWLKLFLPPPLPFRRGKTSHAPPSCVVAPAFP